MTNRAHRRSVKFTNSNNPNSNMEPLVKNSLWTRIKSWVKGTSHKAATFTKNFSARVGAAFKRVANSKAVKAVTFVIPSVRKFLHNTIAFFLLAGSLMGMVVNPVITLITLASAYIFFRAAAWAVGKLEMASRRGSRAATVTLDILDVFAKTVVIVAEIGTVLLMAKAMAAASVGTQVFEGLLICGVIAIDVRARKRVADYQTRVNSVMPDAEIEHFVPNIGVDPFGPASSARAQ